MAEAKGSRHELSFQKESAWGITPTTPDMTASRHTSCTLALTKQTFLSNELRSDRQIAFLKHGNFQVGGNINIELSYGEYDPFIAAVIGASTWSSAYSITSTSVAIDSATKTLTLSSGTWKNLGVRVGHQLTFTDFTDPANNVAMVVSSISGLDMVVTSTSPLVTTTAESVNATTNAEKIITGTANPSFQIERGFSDITQYQLFSGCFINSLNYEVTPNGIVSGAFGIVGKNVVTSTTPFDSSIAASQTTDPFDSFSGYIEEGGTTIAVATNLSQNITNNRNPRFVIGSKAAATAGAQRCNITGTLSAFFQNMDLLNKFINESASSLTYRLGSGQMSYEVHLPNIKYTGGDNPVNGEDEIILNMPFQALYDATLGGTAQFTRTPAAV